MLHEILLSLSGYTSPLWEQLKTQGSSKDDSIAWPLSPQEKALLAPLGELSELHIKLKGHARNIASSHTSTICRAVASRIISQHITSFRQEIIEVEQSILTKDAGYVGGYGIVPLSRVVAKFAPWNRRLEWLWEVARFMLPERGQENTAQRCGAATIDFLERESHTGYSDVEQMAISLLLAAQTAWMHQVATWLLYGKLPSIGAQDFFIHEDNAESGARGLSFAINNKLLPDFVDSSTATSMLFIGNSLKQLSVQSERAAVVNSTASPNLVSDLLPIHLGYLKSLNYPLFSSDFGNVISSIRLSLSQNALSHLLPLAKVLNLLEVFQQYFLLGSGEFATSLITYADSRTASRQYGQDTDKPVRKAGRVDDMTVKDAETAALINQTFVDLASRQDDDSHDEILETARALVRLEANPIPPTSKVRFVSSLLPEETVLTLSIPTDSPMKLFLSKADVDAYSCMSSFLLSVCRAEIHLSSLWKLTPMRRCHPCPVGPPISATKAGGRKLAFRRARDSERGVVMRQHWATMSKALFLIKELGAYIHGEVLSKRWQHLRAWIDAPGTGRPISSSSKVSGRTTTSSPRPIPAFSGKYLPPFNAASSNDPATLAQAHRIYIKSLTSALLLVHGDFVKTVQEILPVIDHVVALFSRLQAVQQGLDLQEDEGVIDVLTNFAKEEKEILAEMKRSTKLIDSGLMNIVLQLKHIELNKEDAGLASIASGVEDIDLSTSAYLPPKTSTLDRLIMKLDFLDENSQEAENRTLDDDEIR